MGTRLRLRGISGEVKGKVWESDQILRAGRLSTLEIVLDDSSVSRRHGEVRYNNNGWFVRDLNSTNGTYVNGVKLGAGERQLHSRDIVQFGKVAMIVELNEKGPESKLSSIVPALDEQIHVEAATSSSWEEGVQRMVYDRNRSPRPGDQMMALLRAGQHLVSIEKEDDLLRQILDDAVSVLEAQRGAIVLADSNNVLQLRAVSNGTRNEVNSRFFFSKKLSHRCYDRGESILCCSVEDDSELKGTQSISEGSMASVLCVLLRTPRRRLGVLHLDRGYFSKPFTEGDLHLADALAANVSSGIECAHLLKKQRDVFLNTISTLAQFIELRDNYTGGHTARVTTYSLLLGEQLGLSSSDLELISLGGPLHDVGKIGIRDEILLKPGKLEPHEMDEMKTHTTKGADIIRTMPDLHPIIPIVKSHHERWDGRGYPEGLKQEEIPLLARIVAVADAFDAMTSNRAYHENKRGKPPEEAMAIVKAEAGKQFDPACAYAFVEIRAKILEAMENSKKQTTFTAPIR
ncbi:HD domain-containing protein [Telmatocola sphagniphila]|uniref:HD domain-containing protein n=1 Tax=Telmatocola sphagniphila TaxID=1123043 RepID=A0A8E6BDL5_9BACT|nr:HD domain-containing protein [Telmatocola sphagniphila]